MAPGNHLISGFVIAESYLALNGYLWQFHDLTKSEVLFYYLPLFAAILIGSVFSDVDIKMNIPGSHRTLTHWPILYLILLSLSLFFFRFDTNAFRLILAFCIGCLVHIGMDYLTFTGVPLGLNPFGRKYSLKLIIVRSSDEMIVSIFLIFLSICIYWVPLLCRLKIAVI